MSAYRGQSLLAKTANTPGFILGWRDKVKHEAGKVADAVMTWGEACKKAQELEKKNPGRVYWAERKLPEFKAH